MRSCPVATLWPVGRFTEQTPSLFKDDMPHVTDMAYVQARFNQFVAKLQDTLARLNYPSEEISKQCTVLQDRLNRRDYWLKDERPVCHLQSGKRVAKFFLRSALEFSPAARAKATRLRAEYAAKCHAIRQRQPVAVFFSFETVYKAKLAPDFHANRALLRL